ncbi:DUF6344 domain-containing protein [Streptomyces sp. CC208A]|uniref:DUF6344 domain-containing protein n=1 Tax=Streptomyces sp. CC208A TaxID=3044573 RepID=UPI0024A8DB53|nr:DUF6344 domain-containing protein [Streptomyces sp. CC208A]
MAAAKIKQFWTAFISVLFALLASVGLAAPAAAHRQAPVTQPEEPATPAAPAPAVAVEERAATVVHQRRAEPWYPVPQGSLPPTIKQRIAAEAHGSSPSTRHPRATAPLTSDPVALTELALATAA